MTTNIIISWWIVIFLHDFLILRVLMCWKNHPFEDPPPKFEFTFRAIEQGLHVDEVARKMVGYTKQQVRYALWHCCTQSYIQNLVDELEESFAFFSVSKQTLHCLYKSWDNSKPLIGDMFLILWPIMLTMLLFGGMQRGYRVLGQWGIHLFHYWRWSLQVHYGLILYYVVMIAARLYTSVT